MWVAVAVFTRVAWGRSLSGRRRCGVCVTVTVFVLCVSWSRVRHMGLRSWSSRTWQGAVVAVNVARASRRSLHVSWSWVQHIMSRSQVPSLRCMRRGCRLCAACGVAVALFAPRGVSPVPLLRQVWCCGGHKRGGNGVARRDVATRCTQQGRARRGGGMSASSLWSVITGRFTWTIFC